MTRWQIFNVSSGDICRRIQKLRIQEFDSFVFMLVTPLSMTERSAEVQFANGCRRHIPLKALRNDNGTIAFSREALRQRGLLQ